MTESQSETHCSFSIEMVESKPFTVSPPESTSNNNCTLLLEPCSSSNYSQDFGLSHAIFDGDFVKYDSPDLVQLESLSQLQSNNEESKQIIDLTEQYDIEMTEKSTTGNEVVVISDDDDVVFVGIIEKTNNAPQNSTDEQFEEKSLESVRRNPMRSARNKSRDLSKELIYEEDFAFLDTSDEEENEKENKVRFY